MTAALGLGPGSEINLITRVSAPPKPPVLTLIKNNIFNITVSWPTLTNETGIITKAWIVAEPYEIEKNTSEVVNIPINNSDLSELPFPNTGVKGFFAPYDPLNTCDRHIMGFTFQSKTSFNICGGFCNETCEYGTPMLDPTTILPTNNQNLTNDNYIMFFNTTNNTILARYVPYLTMKKRFVLNTSDGGLNLNGKIVIGDNKINPNSLLNNTILNPSLAYRFRLIVFTSEVLYAVSDPIEIVPLEPSSGADLVKSLYIGILIAFGVLILLIIVFTFIKKYLKKRANTLYKKENDAITNPNYWVQKNRIIYNDTDKNLLVLKGEMVYANIEPTNKYMDVSQVSHYSSSEVKYDSTDLDYDLPLESSQYIEYDMDAPELPLKKNKYMDVSQLHPNNLNLDYDIPIGSSQYIEYDMDAPELPPKQNKYMDVSQLPPITNAQ